MRRIILIIIFGVFISCNNQKKQDNEKETDTPIYKEIPDIENDKKINKDKYPEVENISDKLDFIFQDEFYFDEGLVVKEIGLYKIKEHTYKTVFILGEDANLDKVKSLKMAMMFFPSDPMQLETEKDKTTGFVKTAVGTKIKKMGDELVFVHNEFRIVPKTHKAIRFYFYKGKVVGDNLILNNVTLRE